MGGKVRGWVGVGKRVEEVGWEQRLAEVGKEQELEQLGQVLGQVYTELGQEQGRAYMVLVQEGHKGVPRDKWLVRNRRHQRRIRHIRQHCT